MLYTINPAGAYVMTNGTEMLHGEKDFCVDNIEGTEKKKGNRGMQ